MTFTVQSAHVAQWVLGTGASHNVMYPLSLGQQLVLKCLAGRAIFFVYLTGTSLQASHRVSSSPHDWFFMVFLSTVSQRQRPNNSVLVTKQQALQYDPPSQLHLVTPAPTLALCRCLKIEKKKNKKEKKPRQMRGPRQEAEKD